MTNPEVESNPEIVNPNAHTVAVINFGSQHTLEIKDAIERNGVRAEVFDYTVDPELVKDHAAFVFSGGSRSVYEKDAPQLNPALMDLKKPTYGICYGAYLIAKHYGGKVKSGKASEFGVHTIHRQRDVETLGVLAGTGSEERVWMNHGDRISKLPKGFKTSAVSSGGVIAGFIAEDKKTIGVQFHPEVPGTEFGDDLFARFLFDVAKIEPTFEPQTAETRIAAIREQVGDKHVLMFLSGGVDSTVMAKLVQAGVPSEQIHAVLVDHGFMRSGETEEVQKALKAEGIDVLVYDARKFFLHSTTMVDGQETPPLKDVWRPEEKRKIIGDAFMRVQEVVAEQLNLPEGYLLAQGSIRPDLIESGSHGTETIKTHHNDSPLARLLRNEGRLLEPVADLYKPGVRALGRILDLSEQIVKRQPFPGPGLAIRILCELRHVLDKKESKKLRKAEKRVGKFATSKTGVHVIPVRSVGQQGDGRRYGRTVVLNGAEDWDELLMLAKMIPEKVKDVTRVTYAFDAPVDAFRVTKGWFNGRFDQIRQIRKTLDRLTPTRLVDVTEQLKTADAIVREELTNAGLDGILQQVPVIMIPHGFDKTGRRSIVLRPFLTTNFMTGTPAIPGSDKMPLPVLRTIVDRILSEVGGIGRVLYDLTGKPPGTTEWE